MSLTRDKCMLLNLCNNFRKNKKKQKKKKKKHDYFVVFPATKYLQILGNDSQYIRVYVHNRIVGFI